MDKLEVLAIGLLSVCTAVILACDVGSPSENDITGVWRNDDGAVLNFYGSPEHKVLYDYKNENEHLSYVWDGEGTWSIVADKVHLEYTIKQTLVEKVWTVPSPLGGDIPVGGSIHKDTFNKVEDYEFLPPRTLRTEDGVVYTKQ